MEIKKLRISKFKSFYSETTIDFASLQGLHRIYGQIGSGKTTIGEAIIYGLYGSIGGKNNKDLISWGEKHALVELWCSCNGHDLYIKREINAYGQSPMFVEVDGEPIIFTNKKDAQSQLEQDYLDTPRSTMELLCIVSFNNFKSLSTMNTKDTKLFLDQVLGFNVLSDYVEKIKELQSDIRKDISVCGHRITANQRQIDRMNGIVMIEGDPDEVQKQLDETKVQLSTARTAKINELSPLQSRLTELQSRLNNIKILGQQKKKEIDFIERGTCPTCGAPISQESLELKKQEKANLTLQWKETSTLISDLTAQISQVNEKHNKCIAELETRVKSQENELIRLREQQKRVVLDQDEIVVLESEIAESTSERDKLNISLSEYDQLSQIMQTQIRSRALESFIPSINMKIKEFASMLSMPYVPEFDATFKCTIKSGGIQQIPTSSLSTGQLKIVDTVIILSILGSVINKAQSNILFLDELFSNLDGKTREEMIGVLRASLPASNSILIVSHQDMGNELFDGQLKLHIEQTESGHKSSIIEYIKL